MHDLIREMDETINSEKSPTQPGRLEDSEAVINVLTNESGTEEIEALSLDLPSSKKKASFSTKAFVNMEKLRLPPKNTGLLLSELVLSESSIGLKILTSLLRKMKILDCSGSRNLQNLPDFSTFPNLEELKLPGQFKRLSLVDFDDCGQLRYLPWENVNVDAISSVNMANSAVMQANPAEWIFLVSSLCMEILSAACDQASSPRRPRYSLFGMLFAIAALLTCIWELIYKGRKKNVGLRKRGCYMLFGSAIETYGLVGGIAQCVCSIIQYVYYIRRADTPIKLSLLPAIFLICLITARLSRKQMLATDQTHEHIA
ncbi:disease resistance protein RML1A-like [Pyrus communis]|uniref:disease resistance protein RML1A-like n=1 Tax=Pyrus communis TaxID=23211 RepID=UPI0035C0FDFA